jgi:hypothetical protein
MRPARSDETHRRGQALVELAIILPVLLLLMLAALDLGRIFYARIAVTNAAREGAMEATRNPGSWSPGAACSTSNTIMCAATREAQNGGFVVVAPADVAYSRSGDQVSVTVTGHFTLITPLMAVFTGGSGVTFASTASSDVIDLPAPAGPAPTPSPTPTPTPTPTPDPSATPGPTPTPTATPSPTPSCPLPSVGYTYTQQNKNKPVVFTSISTPTSGACAITYWRWEFGDGQTDAGNLPSTSHTYPAQGTSYTATLTVTNPGGSVAYTATVTTR